MDAGTPHPGYRALRRGRWSEPGCAYLLTAAAGGRRTLFADWKAASTIARSMSDPRYWPNDGLLCWVLMPDHWHGLVALSEGLQLAELMRIAKGRSARALNRRLGCSGQVWMPGFHDRAIRREEDIVDAARYIVANPLRAGLVRRLGDYPYWDAVWLSENRRG